MLTPAIAEFMGRTDVPLAGGLEAIVGNEARALPAGSQMMDRTQPPHYAEYPHTVNMSLVYPANREVTETRLADTVTHYGVYEPDSPMAKNPGYVAKLATYAQKQYQTILSRDYDKLESFLDGYGRTLREPFNMELYDDSKGGDFAHTDGASIVGYNFNMLASLDRAVDDGRLTQHQADLFFNYATIHELMHDAQPYDVLTSNGLNEYDAGLMCEGWFRERAEEQGEGSEAYDIFMNFSEYSRLYADFFAEAMAEQGIPVGDYIPTETYASDDVTHYWTRDGSLGENGIEENMHGIECIDDVTGWTDNLLDEDGEIRMIDEDRLLNAPHIESKIYNQDHYRRLEEQEK